MAIFYVLIILLPLMHIVLWLLSMTAWRSDGLKKTAVSVVLVLMVLVIGFGTYNAYSPNVRAYDIQVDKDAGNMEKLNIVMASDMHFGVLSGKAHAKRMVKEINRLNPDLVLFPGDIIDDDLDAYLRQGIDRILTDIQAPYGVYASLNRRRPYPSRSWVRVKPG